MSQATEVVFAISLGALIYVYLGYPVFLALLSAFYRRTRPAPGNTPRLSFLIAAYNEEASIGRKIDETLALDYPPEKLEILVLSDGSIDNTDSMVASRRDPRVRLVRINDRKGKTNVQNAGAREATGEILVFSDATTLYHPQALRFIVSNYSDPTVGAVSGRYQYFDPEGRSPTGLGTIAFWNYENLIKMMQSRIRTITGCCGCIYSVRKAVYTALSPDVISDLVQPLHVIRQGYRVVFEDRALAYEETTKSTTHEFSMRVRIVTRGMRGLLSVRQLLVPWRFPWVSFQLWSHKVLRWLIPFFLIVLFGSNLALWNRPGFSLILLAQIFFYFMALVSLLIPVGRRWKFLGIPLYFCTLNAAALFSVVEVLRGKKYAVWQTIRT